MSTKFRVAAIFSLVTLVLAANPFEADPLVASAAIAVTSELSHTPVRHAVSAHSYIESGVKLSVGVFCFEKYGDSLDSLGGVARKTYHRKQETEAEKDNSEVLQCFRILSGM